MNRIILIGNGFDLAHKIKTSYCHFITDYWGKIILQVKNVFDSNTTTYLRIFETDDLKIEGIPGPWIVTRWFDASNYEEFVLNLKNYNIEIVFKNEFLEILTRKKKEQNWLDIELEYYRLLKNSFQNMNSSYKIERLNKDFDNVKILLESYLKEVEEKFIEEFGKNITDMRLKDNIGHKIYSPFKLKDFTEASINRNAQMEFQKFQTDVNGLNSDIVTTGELSEKSRQLISRIGKDGTLKDMRKLLISDTAINYFELMPDEILFLNFNYTFTEKLYSNHTQFDSFDSKKNIIKRYIHIHGTTDKYDRNDVIFGFGDEIDEDYKSIENLNDNLYLENIKSIKYLETDNYKQLLEFLNSSEYQIFTFGHSCGISDRTLLNTLFEHKNCSSIKPFYYRKNNDDDNYSDIVKNISRNFNNKPIMRDKVVNKEYCEPLS